MLDFLADFRLYVAMKKFIFLLYSLFFSLPLISYALDPVAPKADRAFGFFKVETPQSSDTCELLRLNPAHPPYKTSCQPNTMMSVPVGEYQLNIRMQEYSWNEKVNIHPTEYTSIAVLGYGNLLVNSPRATDFVEVINSQGKEVAQFGVNQVKTIPVGSYEVKVKSKGVQASMNKVVVIADKTRELIVSYP